MCPWLLDYMCRVETGWKLSISIMFIDEGNKAVFTFPYYSSQNLKITWKFDFLPQTKGKTNVDVRNSPGMRNAALPTAVLHRHLYTLFVPIKYGHGNIFCNRRGPRLHCARTACKWHSGKWEGRLVESLESTQGKSRSCFSPVWHSPPTWWIEQLKADDQKDGKWQWKMKGNEINKQCNFRGVTRSAGETSCTQ